MHGSIWQWCQDWYGPYSEENKTDPKGANFGESRVHRGGSWCNIPEHCRAASRFGRPPAHRGDYCGCRVCFFPEPLPKEPSPNAKKEGSPRPGEPLPNGTPPPGRDLLQVGSVWRGEQHNLEPRPSKGGCTLTITKRDGAMFWGKHSYDNGWDAEVAGEVRRDGILTFRFNRWIQLPPGAKPVRPLGTIKLLDGRLAGEKISMEFEWPPVFNDAGPTRYTIVMTLQRPPDVKDLIQVGSLWRGEQHNLEPRPSKGGCNLAITKRDGAHFLGEFRYSNGFHAEIEGDVIGDGMLTFRYNRWIQLPPGAKPVRPLGTIKLLDGRLAGEKISMEFEWPPVFNDAGPTRYTIVMTLQRPPGE